VPTGHHFESTFKEEEMKKTGQNKNRRGGRKMELMVLIGLVLLVIGAAIVRTSQQLQARPAQTAGLSSASTALQQDEQRQRQQQPAAQVPPQDQVPGQSQASQQSQKSPQSSQSTQTSRLSQSSSGSLLPRETDAEKAARLKWWTDSRFGLFIHFGLYALPARHEWVKNHERLTNEQYQKYFDHFNPDLFNPREWARMAKAAGMKYVVITSKHHEGFCLWDSKYTDYKATNTPFGRDLLKEFVEAFRAEGLKVGFYYSLLDWHHPDYTIDRVHPLRPDSEADYDRLNAGKDMNRYRQYMKNQVRELLTNYGEISIMWFDFSFPGKHGKGRDDWDSVGLLKLARSLQPNIIVDDRLDLQDVEGGWDFTTPEQVVVTKWPEYKGKKIPWETCQTFSGSWGYYRDEYTWKSPSQLIELLINSVSKGGNLLLNVGPTARGTFDHRAQERLKAMGDWMALNSRSIYGCTQAPPEFAAPPNTLLTWNPATRRLYVHLLSYPLNGLWLKGLAGKVEYVQFLHDASEIHFEPGKGEEASDLWLSLPVAKPPVEIPVLEVFIK
jgi:alpha-L-fucosidase